MEKGSKKSFVLQVLLFAVLLNICLDKELDSQSVNNSTNFVSNPYLYNCTVLPAPAPLAGPNNRGFIKPSVTDYNAPPNAYFPVLIVFIQFANDPGPDCSWWPKGSSPDFLNRMIASFKKYPVNGNWWDTYSEDNELLSDYWLEQSRGHFHVVGQAVSVILDHDYHYYQGSYGYEKVNDEVYSKLSKLGTIDWRQYDKWSTSFNVNQLSVQYVPDGYIDMIYFVYRSRPPLIDLPPGGAAALGESYTQGENYLIDSANGIYINGDYYFHGSGITLTPGFGGDETDTTSYFINTALDKTSTASFSEHEMGHYIFAAGHVNYGKMSGSGNPYGLDECLSPWESIYLGYMNPRNVDYNVSGYQIGDYSSRNSSDTGEVLQVPVGTNEFFLIANRTKRSTYDKIMWGDTAHGNPYRAINPNYGKGVYIYHVSGGYIYPAYVDQECADGLYHWSFRGYEHPDWSNDQNVEYYARDSVSYDNDQSLGSFNTADGKSIFTWFSIGAKQGCLYCDGTDKIFTNKSEVWTSREFQGDRWDAWKTGYNEIFSPYSSPSTKNWFNNNTGIFIWLYQEDTASGTASFRIYRTGSGMTEDDILAVTPPSKPMSLLSKLTACENGFQYPEITWHHNMEPDMINTSTQYLDKKFYNVYKAISKNLAAAPSQYKYLTTVNINKDSIPYFIDYDEPIRCGGNSPVKAVRYVVSAVDGSGWESVKSDFASIIVNENNVIFDNFNNLQPVTYELYQNYPNPFNPETKIKFALARSGHVKITVFNVIGEQVAVPVNDFRTQGQYTISFSGADLSSGIYFYRIDTPGFTKTRKMVLLK